MGNKAKLTVDYFPHFAHQGRTIFILKNQFGNDGYAFWYQLLELLCSSENHFLDCSIPENLEFLYAKIGIIPTTGEQILNKLAERSNIDAELWRHGKIIWCQALIDNLTTVYDRRSIKPKKPSCVQQSNICIQQSNLCVQDVSKNQIDVNIWTGSKVKESKVKESKVKESKNNIVHRPENLDAARFREFWSQYPRKENRKNAETSFYRLKLSDDDFTNLISGLGRQKMCDQWTRDNGKFIPHPTTWLYGRRWEDVEIKIDPLSGLNPTQRAVMEHRRKRLENGEQIAD